MKFHITIESSTQPGLIEALDICRKRLIQGGCFVNQSLWGGETTMKPDAGIDEAQFRALYDAAHPKATANWTDS